MLQTLIFFTEKPFFAYEITPQTSGEPVQRRHVSNIKVVVNKKLITVQRIVCLYVLVRLKGKSRKSSRDSSCRSTLTHAYVVHCQAGTSSIYHSKALRRKRCAEEPGIVRVYVGSLVAREKNDNLHSLHRSTHRRRIV